MRLPIGIVTLNGIDTMETLFQWLLPNVGAVLAAIGLGLTVWTLRRNHDWNRRHYTMSLVSGWEEQTACHKEAIEKAFPGLVIAGGPGPDHPEITDERTRIYSISSAKKRVEKKTSTGGIFIVAPELLRGDCDRILASSGRSRIAFEVMAEDATLYRCTKAHS